ncbi:MAG: hypothetical protein CVU41_18420 [Chloroflexi bacterium HGW-Chloroflexi-3]|nr:MAG: hypothetical protein CVU41_18420 [Chloroflexi bacterium HGW-Chloroflexi-3]
MTPTTNNQVPIDPYYVNGEFFKISSGEKDAEYKVNQLANLMLDSLPTFRFTNGRVADVGCGTGKTTFLLKDMLEKYFNSPIFIDGYDIHPALPKLKSDNVNFYTRDFISIDHNLIYDLVVLFDVIEHVINPMEFLSEVSKHTKYVGLHIPLDDSFFTWTRNIPRKNLTHPGHLSIFNSASAINLITNSGLRIIDFSYSPVFKAPSGAETKTQIMTNPIRSIFYNLSPYITQKFLGGVSLIIIAATKYGL